MARPAAEAPFISGPALVQRWDLGHLDEAKQRRFLRHLREQRLVRFSHPTPRVTLYMLSDIIALEENGMVLTRDENRVTTPARRKRGRKAASR